MNHTSQHQDVKNLFYLERFYPVLVFNISIKNLFAKWTLPILKLLAFNSFNNKQGEASHPLWITSAITFLALLKEELFLDNSENLSKESKPTSTFREYFNPKKTLNFFWPAFTSAIYTIHLYIIKP